MKPFLRALALCWLLMTALAAVEVEVEAAPDDGRAADHAALRALLERAVAALNSGDPARLGDCLAPGLDLTFADQHHLRSIAELTAYATRLRVEHDITAITFAPTSDGPARFLGEDVAIATGTSHDTFVGGGAPLVIDSRWTATLQRSADGWRIATLHIGVDLMDNAILTVIRRTALMCALGAAVVTLLVGFLLGRWLGRRRA